MAGGNGATGVITSDGTVLTCGNNGYSQLGDPSVSGFDGRNTLGPINTNVKFSAIAVASLHMLALSNGTVYVWGSLTSDGSSMTTNASPVPIDTSGALINKTVTAISTANVALFSAIITSDGQVFTFGANANGQLGGMLLGSNTNNRWNNRWENNSSWRKWYRYHR